MDNLTLAYLAGAMDADGHFTIKRSTQRKRNSGDCVLAVYSPRAGLGQVTPQVPELLKRCFGGTFRLQAPATENSRPLFKYLCSDRMAARLAHALMPYLRIKSQQAQLLC